jgi:hypothetical protein
MVSTSKILTVSYGTFSCTLEGFDDSFETMKAIAEYFRDLAAEDRYFGAEPPVPDAEMLARIAEREIARRVDAREERGNIVLRAAPYGAVAAPLAPQADAAFAAPQTTPQAQPQPAPVQQAAPAPQPAATAPIAETVTEPVAKAPAAPQEPAADEWEDVSLEDFSSNHIAAPHVAAPLAGTPLRPTPVPHPDPESVAAKLQRIRDVVTKTAAAPAADTYSEDEHAENFLAAATESIETALAEDAAADLDAGEDDGDEIAALLSRLTGEATPAQPEEDAAVAADDLADDLAVELADADEESIAQDIDADLIAEDLAADDLVHQDTTAKAEPAEDDDFADDSLSAQVDEDDLIEVEIAGDEDDVAESADLPARVIKMKRAEFEAALAKGELVPDDADDADDEDEAIAVATTAAPEAETHTESLRILPEADLTPAEQEDLRRDLAAVEAELVDIYRDTEDHADPRATDDLSDEDDDDDELTSLFDEDDEDKDAAEDKAPLVLRDPREQLVNVRAEDDMSRLMAKAESAMTEPESASRRNAIAHLRAAVAATKAEHSAGTLPNREPAANAFRDDLDSVVRPRRPMGDGSAATPRPADPRPAPLKLVAEQRVDLQGERASSPVRPRRVSLAPLPEETEEQAPNAAAPAMAEGEFADFASKMGATALPDLLEAAAAYLVHVEGREEFSRPQLMNKARQGTSEALSREDGLRSFGQLLRQGKIQKVRGGRFTASEDIGFKPAARRAG